MMDGAGGGCDKNTGEVRGGGAGGGGSDDDDDDRALLSIHVPSARTLTTPTATTTTTAAAAATPLPQQRTPRTPAVSTAPLSCPPTQRWLPAPSSVSSGGDVTGAW